MEVMEYNEELDRDEREEVGEIESSEALGGNNNEVNAEADAAESDAETPKNTKRMREADPDEVDFDSGQCCPICMDLWSNSGEHRLCSLRCGHLFGHKCILHWLQMICVSSTRRCPQCNRKAAVKDIRILYAKKLSVVDTSEIDNLKQDLNNVTIEKNRIEMDLARCNLRQKLYEQQIASMRLRISELENQRSEINTNLSQATLRYTSKKFHLDRSFNICKEGGCRVLDYNPWYGFLVVSQKSTNILFSGYGIKKIDSYSFQPRQFVFLHSQAIRDISFHPTQKATLLSVSFDKSAKLMDIQNNLVIHSYQIDSQFWSCCWSGENPNVFLAGAQNGSVAQFDIRQTSGAVEVLDSPRDRSPVVSLTTIPSNSCSGIMRGGFIACHLNTCCAYEQKNGKYLAKQLFLEGPFVSVRYDKRNNHILVSSRPNIRRLHAKHMVCTIEKGNEETIVCNVIHTFQAGNSQQLLSRPCYVNVEDDTYVAAHQESTSCIPLWSVSTGKQVHSLPVSDPVVDLCSFQANNNLFLATLSSTKLRLYNYGQLL